MKWPHVKVTVSTLQAPFPTAGSCEDEKMLFSSHLPFIGDWQFHQVWPCHLRRLKVKPDKADVRASAVDGPDFFFSNVQ